MVAPFRILAVSHSANLDGAEQVFLETFVGLHRRGHAVLAVLPGKGPLATALDTAGIAVEFQPLPWWILPPGQLDAGHLLAQLGPQVESLTARIQAHRADLVHTGTSVVLHGALAARLAGLPHVWQIHEMLGEPLCGLDPTLGADRTWQLMARLSSLPRGRLVVASDAMRDRARGHLEAAGLSAAAIDRALRLLPHGHDLSAYRALPLPGEEPAGPPPGGGPKSARLRANAAAAAVATDTDMPSPGAPPRFVVIAAVTPRKGIDWLIDALAAHGLAGAGAPAYEIEVIGAAHDAAYLKSLQAQVKQAGLGKRIRWSGYCTDLPARLKTARAVLHPSRNDPSPVGLILAMAAGKPIVATRCGGPEKMLIDGVSGRLVALEDAAGFAAEIKLLLADPVYGRDWCAPARKAAEESWSLETYLDGVEGMYNRVCAGAADAETPGSGDAEAAQGDIALFWAVLDACHRHVGTALSDLKHLTPRQQKALNGIVQSAKLLKRALPESIYERIAKMF